MLEHNKKVMESLRDLLSDTKSFIDEKENELNKENNSSYISSFFENRRNDLKFLAELTIGSANQIDKSGLLIPSSFIDEVKEKLEKIKSESSQDFS